MVSILIPVFNEEKILGENLQKLESYLLGLKIPFEVLVINNGSTDGTEILLENLEKQFHWLKALSIPGKSVGRAFAKGVSSAKFPNVISMDADLSVELTFIEQALRLLENAAMVVGSKTMGTQKRSWLRVIGSQIYLLITQVLFHMVITDFSMGAKAYKRAHLLGILNEIDKWTAYVFEICIWLNLNQQSIVQIGVRCSDQRKSRFNIWHEGVYRYQNLFKVWRKLRDPQSWFHRIRLNPS